MLKKLTLKIGSSPREEVAPAPVVPAPKETFIQKMKTFTARKWSHSPTDIFTTTSKIELGCWNRRVEEGRFDVLGVSGDNLAEGSAMSMVTTNNTVAEAPPQTFVCPHRNCHKIFNSRANWKRHQTLHRKKDEAAAATAAAAVVVSTNEESIVVNVEGDSPPVSDDNASSMVSNSTSPKTKSTTTTTPSPPNKIKLVLNINRHK